LHSPRFLNTTHIWIHYAQIYPPRYENKKRRCFTPSRLVNPKDVIFNKLVKNNLVVEALIMTQFATQNSWFINIAEIANLQLFNHGRNQFAPYMAIKFMPKIFIQSNVYISEFTIVMCKSNKDYRRKVGMYMYKEDKLQQAKQIKMPIF